MTFKSLTENEKHDIPSQMLKAIFGPQYVWFLAHL